MGSPAIFSGTFAKFLKSNLNLNDAAYILTGTADPSSSATNAPAGSLYLNTSTGATYRKTDAGSSTNWTNIVSFAATTFNDPKYLYNIGLSTAVSSGTLTVTLTQSDGSTAPAAGAGAALAAVRHPTATTGAYNIRSITSALSQTITSGTVLTLINYATPEYMWVYLIDSDSAGTMKLGVASARYDDGTLVSTVGDAPVVTISNASPAVVTLANHGYVAGDQVSFQSSGGTLPTGLSANTTYFVISTGLTSSTFRIANSYAGAAKNTSSNGSGTFHVFCNDSRIVSAAAYSNVAARCIGRILGPTPTGASGWPSGMTEVALATPAVVAAISPVGGKIALTGRNIGSYIPTNTVNATTNIFPITTKARSDGTPDETNNSGSVGIPLGAAVTGILPVVNGGTALGSGTSGGILGYTGSGTLASSAALTANQLIKGGGAGVTPSTLAAGTQYQVLRMDATPNPTYGTINLDQAAAVTGQLVAASFPALTGDITTAGGALATTAAATQANIATLSKATGVAVHGTNTNDNGGAGYVGEFISANSAGVAWAASGSWVQVASISLTAGDWDVEGTCVSGLGGTTAGGSNMQVTLSSTTAAQDNTAVGGWQSLDITFTNSGATISPAMGTGTRRFSLSGTSTIYLNGLVYYTVLGGATWTSSSFIQARRVR